MSKLYIDKSEKSTKLLAKCLLDVIQIKKKVLAEESKPRDKIQKNLIVKPYVEILDPEIVIKKEKVAILITETTSKIYEQK